MNQKLKASSLVLFLTLTPLYTSTADARRWQDEVACGLTVAIGVTAVGYGIGALWGALSWSDSDILKWAKDGLEDIDLKYQQLNHHGGPLMARLQLFGNRNSTSSSFWKTDIENITANNRSLAPLHNTIIIMNDDRDQLKKYYGYLMQRNLNNHPRGKKVCEQIVQLLNDFENLSAVILSSPEYTGEEQALHEKLHQLKQERLQRERNEALEAQARSQRQRARAEQEHAEAQRELARSQREQARAQRELADAQRRQQQQPTIIIINNETEQESHRPAGRATEERTEREHLRDLEVIFDY